MKRFPFFDLFVSGLLFGLCLVSLVRAFSWFDLAGLLLAVGSAYLQLRGLRARRIR